MTKKFITTNELVAMTFRLELFMTTIVTISNDFVVVNGIVFVTTLISSLKNFFVTIFV